MSAWDKAADEFRRAVQSSEAPLPADGELPTVDNKASAPPAGADGEGAKVRQPTGPYHDAGHVETFCNDCEAGLIHAPENCRLLLARELAAAKERAEAAERSANLFAKLHDAAREEVHDRERERDEWRRRAERKVPASYLDLVATEYMHRRGEGLLGYDKDGHREAFMRGYLACAVTFAQGIDGELPSELRGALDGEE